MANAKLNVLFMDDIKVDLLICVALATEPQKHKAVLTESFQSKNTDIRDNFQAGTTAGKNSAHNDQSIFIHMEIFSNYSQFPYILNV